VRGLQEARTTETEIVRRGDRTEIWLQFHPVDPSRRAVMEQVAEVKRILGIPAELDRVRITFATLAPEPEVVGIRTRSLFQILATLGAGIQIQQDHVATGRSVPVDWAQVPPGFRVQSGTDRPDEVYVAVSYAGVWFWIDHGDLASKTTLAAVTILFNFLEGGVRQAPVLTIPAN
jgi:hypothetical protein